VSENEQDSRIRRAIEVLQNAQRYRLERDPHGAWMKGCSDGLWYDGIDITQVLWILQEQPPQKTGEEI
jgi:hypothetical protein